MVNKRNTETRATTFSCWLSESKSRRFVSNSYLHYFAYSSCHDELFTANSVCMYQLRQRSDTGSKYLSVSLGGGSDTPLVYATPTE